MPQPQTYVKPDLTFSKIKNVIFLFIKIKNSDLYLIFSEGFSKDIVVGRFVGGCVRKHLSGDKILMM